MPDPMVNGALLLPGHESLREASRAEWVAARHIEPSVFYLWRIPIANRKS